MSEHTAGEIEQWCIDGGKNARQLLDFAREQDAKIAALTQEKNETLGKAWILAASVYELTAERDALARDLAQSRNLFGAIVDALDQGDGDEGAVVRYLEPEIRIAARAALGDPAPVEA